MQDTTLAGIPFEAELPEGVQIAERPLFQDDDALLQKGARKFVAFASGLNFGHLGDV